MKRLISILILTIVSTVVFAQELPREWKWKKAYSSTVLISGEITYEEIIQEGTPEEFFEEKEKEQPPEFNNPQEEPRLPEFAVGTGFFINKVHIVTNYHVIKNADIIKIYTYEHPFVIKDVKVVGYDEEIDIAVLEIFEDVEHDYLDCADKVPYIGDKVYALGHGMNQIWSLTEGIMSYDYRSNPGTSFVHYWQTDAVINSGNSGGPLLNTDSEVVGINTLLISPNRTYAGYGYVIPSPLAKRTVMQILGTGEHVKPSIGIMMSVIDDRDLYDKLKAEGLNNFLEIQEIIPDSPAYKFGLMAGDIIIAIDDHDIQVTPHVIELLWQRMPGDQLSIDVYRNGEFKTIELVLGKQKKKISPSYPKLEPIE